MAPLPALHIKALDDLAAQLRFAPPAAARRQMERAEELLSVISPAQNYPEDWIVFAITGYRPELAAPSLVVGSALLGELAVLIERLGVAAGLTPDDLPGLHDPEPQWLDADQLCARWSISRKTLDRHRRAAAPADGAVLPARRIRTPAGREKLYFPLHGVREFEARRGEALRQAASFSRIEPEVERKIVRLAARYHERLGWTLNQTAKRLAQRFGRGHETVRQLLQRAEQERPVFAEPGPLSPRHRRVVARAYARGVPVEILARRFTRSRPSIYRVLTRERADALRTLRLLDEDAPEFARQPPPSLARALDAPSVNSGLGLPAPGTLAELLRYVEAEPVTDPRAERERATAYWILRARASDLIGEFPLHQAAAGACDEAETLLRWASRLKAELVRSQLGLIPRNVRSATGRELTNFPRASAGALLDECTSAIIEATDRFDPSKGGRLAAPAGLALTRVLTRWAKAAPSPSAGRAQPTLDPASLMLTDWTARVDDWQAALEPDPRVRRTLDRISAEHAAFLRERFAWAAADGHGVGPPQSIAAVAPRLGMTQHHASALEHLAIAEALRASRVPGTEAPRG
jgi:RNA polymerase primary sigma factor/RNA polymerase sigma factor